MSKLPFLHAKTATVSNQIEGYPPSKDKEVIKKVQEYFSQLK